MFSLFKRAVVVYHNCDLRVRPDIPDTLQLMRVSALGLGVQRRIQQFLIESVDNGDDVGLTLRIHHRSQKAES